MEFAWGAAAFCALATSLHLVSTAIAAVRCRRRAAGERLAAKGPPVTVIRPVCGLDQFDELTLRSGFELDDPSYELVLCCATAQDPVVPVIRRLMAAHPHVAARLLFGNESPTANPKLNNVLKGWRSTTREWVIIADSNVLMPRDYIQRLLGGWRSSTGLLCSPPVGSHASNFWAEVECAFLNTYQARWQYAADSVGLGFAQGKTMLWRRSDLEGAGGLLALGAESAEDAAATKVVRAMGGRVRLVDAPFAQPLGRRTLRQIWDRQVRWARLRRASFPLCFVPEALTGSLPALIAGVFAADAFDVPAAAVAAALALVWFGSEALLARIAGWQLTALSPLAWALRDLMLPLVWVEGWRGNSFVWRGSEVEIARAG